MAKRSKGKTADNDTSANVRYEAQLWHMADALRGSMDAAEYRAQSIFSVPALRRAWHTSTTFDAPPLKNWCEVASREFRHGVRLHA